MHIPEDEAERRRLNERGREILRRKNGAVRPHREDGYVNLLNKYGTKQDNSEAYKFEREPVIPDMQLTGLYEGNGLFSKIIDTPAEEALKHGFDLNLKSDELNAFVEDALDDLEWEEKAATAIKWARLYGGALIVMLIDDGRGLEEPVDWEHIRSIDELRVYERSIVQPDYASLYQQDYGGKGVGNRVSKFGQPEYYYVSSIYGSFKVHESRCLVFRNGVLPEQTSNATYLFWGMPEYVRIRRALRETVTAHTDSVKLLERSVQAIYSMKGLASLLTTDDGENQVLKRLQLVDTSRGLLNSIAIDSEGEQYDFKTFQFSGVKDVIDATCNMLSALTNIPQTILFGRSPAGMNATGDSDFESYYNFVEKIQRLMLKRNLRTLLDVVFRAGIASGDVTEEPDYKLEFKPLWSLSDTEQAGAYFLDLFFGEREEKLYEACLDAKGRLLACHLVAEGDTDSVQLNMRKIVENALKCGASSVLLSHNHPSGVALPSPADNATTLSVFDALRTVGVELADHIIVADDDFVSLRHNGLLPERKGNGYGI